MIDIIDIKDISGKTRFSTSINKGAKGKFTLMKEDYIILPFSVPSPIPFKLGDYADLSDIMDESLGGKLAKIYEITDVQKPTYNTSTGGYDYELQMNAYYWKWKNKIFKYTPEQAGSEASWSLTATLDVQLGVFLRNLKALGYTYRRTDFIFSIDDTVENKAVAMTYDNMNLLDALFSMAGEDKWNCDCWITDNVIHFGRCEFGDAVKIERDVEASAITRSESQGTYATRIYAFGSTKNIPTNYRPTDEQVVINGVVQKRLMLPADTPYIDAYEGMTQEEAIEDVVVFDDVYPRRVGTLSDVHTRTEEVENDDGTKETVTYYRYKDTGLVFKDEYIIEGQELKIKFQSGKLNGMEFGVIFNPTPKDETRGEQLWEIVRNEDYGFHLPDDTMRPENGDKYVLSGFDIQLVSDQYIPDAEQELKEKAQKYADKVKKDDGTYTTTLMSDWVHEDLISRTFEFGQRVNLVDDTFFENGRVSRVLGWEMNLDIPWNSPIYTIGESMPYSRISDIESDVESLTYKGQTYFGKGGVYLIKANDSTAPSDSNTFSALRALKMFLRKDQQDQTEFLVKFLNGIEIGKFVSGLLGTGGAIQIDQDGNSHAEFDYLTIRKLAIFIELIIQEAKHVGGMLIVSPSGMTISKVEEYDTAYRCYFEQTDGNRTISNQFTVGTQARRQTFNLTNQAYYWRLVTAVGNDYIDLSKTDCDTGSTVPQPGDELVGLGHRTDKTRQSAIIISAFGTNSPSIMYYQGIDSYSLDGKAVKMDYYDKVSGRFKSVTYGDTYVGAMDESTYMKYDQEKGLEVKGRVNIQAGSSGWKNMDGLPEEIQAAADLAQKAQEDIDNAAVGSVNLLKNSGFTGNYETEDMDADKQLDADTELYSKALLNWSGSATVQDDANATSGRSATIGSLSQDVTLIPNEVYAISYKAKGASMIVSCGDYSIFQTFTSDYKRYIHKFTYTGKGVFQISGSATICDLQLERGTIATDWKPSPQDNDSSMAEFMNIKYLINALKNGSVDILGGLILSNVIQLGNYIDGALQKVTAGISGIYNDDNDVYTWGGGTLEQAVYTIMKYKNNPQYQPTDEELRNMANAVITHGGRAILNDVIVRGYIYALGGKFKGEIEADGGHFGNMKLGSYNNNYDIFSSKEGSEGWIRFFSNDERWTWIAGTEETLSQANIYIKNNKATGACLWAWNEDGTAIRAYGNTAIDAYGKTSIRCDYDTEEESNRHNLDVGMLNGRYIEMSSYHSLKADEENTKTYCYVRTGMNVALGCSKVLDGKGSGVVIDSDQVYLSTGTYTLRICDQGIQWKKEDSEWHNLN